MDDDRWSACRRVEELAGVLYAAPTTAPTTNDGDQQPRGAGRPPARWLDSACSRSPICERRTGAMEPRQAALDGVSFSVGRRRERRHRRRVRVGKTTIARILLGLERPDRRSGRTRWHRHFGLRRTLAQQRRAAARRTVQCVFQDPYSSLNPKHSIGYALTEALKQRRGTPADSRRDADVHRTCWNESACPLAGVEAAVRPLSGGQRQRVAIARALAVDPKVLICDEPVASLDVSVQAQVLRLLRQLHSESALTLVFITHDLAVVRQVTDRVIVLEQGRLVEHGQTDTVLDTPNHEITRRLVAAVPSNTNVTG